MSLILEALKKSEQQRRLGEAPNLGTPITVARRRRSLLPVLAAAIAIALGAGWYLLRDKPGTAPDDAKIASASQARTARNAALGTPAVAAKPAAQKPLAVNMPPPHTPPARKDIAADQKTAPAIAPPVLPVAPAQDRPGSVAPPPVPSTADAKTVDPNKPHDRPLPPGPASPLDQAAKSASATANTDAGKPHDRPEPPGPASPLDLASKTASPTPPVTTKPMAVPAPATASAQSAQKPVAQKPALPSVWELPYATRKDLPAIDLTMHVYADTPADRFVVVKGERHVEGDQIADGVTLKQITADGMVLEFKGQDFTFPRDSR